MQGSLHWQSGEGTISICRISWMALWMLLFQTSTARIVPSVSLVEAGLGLVHQHNRLPQRGLLQQRSTLSWDVTGACPNMSPSILTTPAACGFGCLHCVFRHMKAVARPEAWLWDWAAVPSRSGKMGGAVVSPLPKQDAQ